MSEIKLDKEGFELVYRQYWRRLFDFALFKTHDRDASEEIVQDLFVTLWAKRKELQIVNLKSYLFVSMRNRIVDYYERKLCSDLEAAEDIPAPDYPLFLNELEEAVQMAVSELPAKTREIFFLSRLDGLSTREISDKLRMPERTINHHIALALRQLKVKILVSIVFMLVCN